MRVTYQSMITMCESEKNDQSWLAGKLQQAGVGMMVVVCTRKKDDHC